MSIPIQDIINNVYNDAGALNVSSGGGGGGVTVTTETIALLSQSTSQDITHPSVALSSGDIMFGGTLDVLGSPTSEQFDTGWSASTNWTRKSEQGSITQFNVTGDNAGNATGNFDAAAGASVVVGTALDINGAACNIVAIAGDGTGADSVEVSLGFAIATYPVNEVTNVQNSGSPEIANNGVTYVQNQQTWAQLNKNASLDFSSVSTITSMQSQSGSFPVGSTVKIAFSKDGGTTWYYHNGTAWVTMTMSEWATKGCLLVNTFAELQDSTGTDLTSTEYDDFGFNDSGADVRVAIGFLGTTDDQTSVGDLYVSYTSVDKTYDIAHNPQTIDISGGQALLLQRVNATTLRVTNNSSFNDFSNLVVKVWTL